MGSAPHPPGRLPRQHTACVRAGRSVLGPRAAWVGSGMPQCPCRGLSSCPGGRPGAGRVAGVSEGFCQDAVCHTHSRRSGQRGTRPGPASGTGTWNGSQGSESHQLGCAVPFVPSGPASRRPCARRSAEARRCGLPRQEGVPPGWCTWVPREEDLRGVRGRWRPQGWGPVECGAQGQQAAGCWHWVGGPTSVERRPWGRRGGQGQGRGCGTLGCGSLRTDGGRGATAAARGARHRTDGATRGFQGGRTLGLRAPVRDRVPGVSVEPLV